MALIPTRQLMEEYLSDVCKDERTYIKVKSFIMKEAFFEYEERIGKQIVDMTPDEIFGMFDAFVESRPTGAETLMYPTMMAILSRLRNMTEYYIEHYEPNKRNIFTDKRLRGRAAGDRILASRKRYTFDNVQSVINMIHNDQDDSSPLRADYIECILLLFYNGFVNAMEIIRLEEDMIDFDAKEIRLPRAVLHPSDRCLELLKEIHESSEMKDVNGYCEMFQFKNRYFKYPIRRNVEALKSLPDEQVEEKLNWQLYQQINQNTMRKYNVNVQYKKLYMLGFYDFLVREYGVDGAAALIKSPDGSAESNRFMSIAREYGIPHKNPVYIKMALEGFM